MTCIGQLHLPPTTKLTSTESGICCRQVTGLVAFRFVSDLAVGSIALQTPTTSPHAVHMTFSAKQELSGWTPPAAGSEEEGKNVAGVPGPKPRLFMVFEDGSGYEVLDKDLFAAYAQRKVRLEHH